ncbi:Hypothetical protein R9X50_00066300 [Acrodontium crateriforme]|uniref:Uncharacterized protein n=1 Tax=Acrodontium crateriforme TaxID=150365 RepID=A0AAQ3LXM4_9PEZI|nr:Hypothetical protein R9X50_00066300 [Acrodontium crateriforme]
MAAIEFTTREMVIMANAWNCMSEEPKVSVDYGKLAKMCGFTNDRSASNAWRAIVKKIKAKNEAPGNEDGGDDDATPKATVSPKKRGRKDAIADDNESPTKKVKGGKGKKGKQAVTKDEQIKTEDAVDEDDGIN